MHLSMVAVNAGSPRVSSRSKQGMVFWVRQRDVSHVDMQKISMIT